MSGGSMNYICYRMEEELDGKMQDAEINDIVKDIIKLAHSLEWALSDDTDIISYKKDVANFKNKWFKGNRQKRLKGYVDERLQETREELYQLMGIEVKNG